MSRRPLPPNYGGTEDEMSSQGEFLSEYRRKNNHIYQQILLLITFIFGALAGLSAITPLSSTREIQQGQRDLTCALMILAAAALVFTMTSDIDYPTPAFDTSSPTQVEMAIPPSLPRKASKLMAVLFIMPILIMVQYPLKRMHPKRNISST